MSEAAGTMEQRCVNNADLIGRGLHGAACLMAVLH
jgi:hypothetical protein